MRNAHVAELLTTLDITDEESQKQMLRACSTREERRWLYGQLVIVNGVSAEDIHFMFVLTDEDEAEIVRSMDREQLEDIIVQKRLAARLNTTPTHPGKPVEVCEAVLAQIIGVHKIKAAFVIRSLKEIYGDRSLALRLERARINGSLPAVLAKMGLSSEGSKLTEPVVTMNSPFKAPSRV